MNTKILCGVVVVVIAGASFFAGMHFGKSQRGGGNFVMNRQGGMPMMGTDGQGRGGARGPGGAFGMGGRGAGDSMVAGEVLKADADGLTVKLRDNGSKLVITSTSTQVMMATTGTIQDVKIGSNVMIMGTANADGSVTAKNVQVRP